MPRKAVDERDFIAGTFLWTGIDYLGESHDAWPRKATGSGLLDTAEFRIEFEDAAVLRAVIDSW